MKKTLNKINEIKKGLSHPLGGILNYSEDGINLNYFGEVDKINEGCINIFLKMVDEKLKDIKKKKEEVKKNSSLTEKEKEYLINNLNGIGIKLLILKNSTYLEAEKGGYKISIEDRKKYLRRVNKLQDIVYGPEISTFPEEVKKIVLFLHNIFIQNRKKLNDKEKKYFLNFLNSFIKIEELENNTVEEKPEGLKPFENNEIKPDEIKIILDLILDLYGLYQEGWKIVINQETKNFTVNGEKKTLTIPRKNQTKKRLCELIDHEIGVHIIRWSNTHKTLVTSGEGYDKGEEGLAVLSEKLVNQKMEDVKAEPNISHISSFIAENYNGIETKRLLEIYFKLVKPEGTSHEEIERDAKDRTDRIKRYVSMEEKGANRKDKIYIEGLYEIKKLLENGDINEFLRLFYFSKVSLSDIELIKEFKDSLLISEDELKYPLWIGKIIYEKLSGKKVFLQRLKEEDKRFNLVEKLSFGVKRKIVTIIKGFKDF